MLANPITAAVLLSVFLISASSVSAQDCLWSEDSPFPGERIGRYVVFDSTRGVSTFVSIDGLWSWDGSTWSFKWAQYPSVGGEAQFAYDSARQVIVLHGNQKTYEFDGIAWTLKSQAGPLPRTGFRIIYDSIRHVTVLHGGRNNSGFLNDTWEWDGSVWIQVSTSGPIRRSYAAAFDSSRQQVVIFGGEQNFQTQRNFWGWDGISWTQLSNDIGPASSDDAMVFDVIRNVLVLSHSANHWQELWEWDGTTFLNVPIHGPHDRSYYGLVYDAQRQKTILYGGSGRRDHWEWDGAAWTLIGGLTPTSAYLAYNTSQAQVQGVSLCCGISEVWTYQGPDWSVQEETAPPGRQQFAIAYDESRQKIVLFGGRDSLPNPDIQYEDTWEWDGTSWTQRMVPGPPARSGHSMVYDAAREMVVLFGGYITSPTGSNWDEYGDTWGWDGATWTQLAVSGPSARYWHAMTYDRDRQETLLFGGAFYTGLGGPGYGDLWAWDGVEWALLSNPGQNKPGTGYNYSLVYDEEREVSILVSGGWNGDTGGVAYTKTWEWNGTSWTLTVPSDSPRGPAVYDPSRARTVLFDGPTTWEYPGSFLAPPAPVPQQVIVESASFSAVKNRYLSFSPPALPGGATGMAFRVIPSQLPGSMDCPNVGDFSNSFQTQMWVGNEVLHNDTPTGVFELSATPVVRDWSTVPGGVIHVADCNIVPCASYSIAAASDTSCNVGQPVLFSEPTVIATSPLWGDVVGNDEGRLPDGIVDFVDISALVECFRNLPTGPPGTWCDLGGNNPYQGVNLNIDFNDIALVVDSFRGRPYPYAGPTAPEPCPQ